METHGIIVPEGALVLWPAEFLQVDGATRAEAWAKVDEARAKVIEAELDSRLAEQAVRPARELPKLRIVTAIIKSCVFILLDVAFVACVAFGVLVRPVVPVVLAVLAVAACVLLSEPDAATAPVAALRRGGSPAGLPSVAAAVTTSIAFTLVTRRFVRSLPVLAAPWPARFAISTHVIGAEHPEARKRAIASLLHLVSAHTTRQARAMSRRREARRGWLTALEMAAQESDSVRATADPARARTSEPAHHQLPAMPGPRCAREPRRLGGTRAQGFLGSPGPCGKLTPRAGKLGRAPRRCFWETATQALDTGQRHGSAWQSSGSCVQSSLARASTAGGSARPVAQRWPSAVCATNRPDCLVV